MDRPPCCGDATGARAASRPRSSRSPLAFLGVFFVWPVVAILGRGLWPRRLGRPRPARRRAHRSRRCATSSGSRSGRPSLSTVLTLADRAPGRVRARAATGSAGAGLVRALVTVPFVLPDRRRRRPRSAPSASTGSLGGDPARARVLQLRGRRADRRRPVVAPRPAGPRRRRRCSARAGGGRSSRVTLPALRPALVGRGLDRVPVLLHVVRRDPGARRPDATRRSRPRSTGRPRSSSTSRSPPRSRSCSSPRSSPRSASAAGPGPARRGARPPRPPTRRAAVRRRPRARRFVAANLALDGRCSSARRSRCSSRRSFGRRPRSAYRALDPRRAAGSSSRRSTRSGPRCATRRSPR